ncbi:hypothetical protein LPJ61_003926 [Coemansia biformis]|uniref:Fungal-type protein kinase domain-containing protein n=1 Tax=Coemansia biformis TaxID=1286918 RepID=A0A9W8CVU5_9FUNG|nr:hypothetical protein LPJ61_003926 [Coemansia biformis]
MPGCAAACIGKEAPCNGSRAARIGEAPCPAASPSTCDHEASYSVAESAACIGRPASSAEARAARAEVPAAAQLGAHEQGEQGEKIKEERAMYPGISAFVKFVADKQHSATDEKPEGAQGLKGRRVEALHKADATPTGADVATRTDHMLIGCLNDGDIADLGYAEALCLVKAKLSPRDQTQAYEQLVMYSRNIYAKQLRRRFVWGLTVCGTLVRACLITHDRIFSSSDMDVSEPAGLARFVSLLIDWSLCEITRLGYDPTIEPSKDGNGWDIRVFDDMAQKSCEYGNLTMIFQSPSVFGRHTRCFVGTSKTGAETGSVGEKVLIKDYWAHIGGDADDPRDEITYLREIREKLGKALDGKYPRIEAGGVVQIKGPAGEQIGDTTTALTAGLGLAEGMPLWVHKRIAMSPIGEPLEHIQSEYELIIAFCDAMEAHAAIHRECKILHRDISINNILLRRVGDVVGSMVIDLDNAMRTGCKHVAAEPDRTGTLPYMRIGSLENSSVDRTELDDWESALYILCWLGTIGINLTDQDLYARRVPPPIQEWLNGATSVIAQTKRTHMGSTEAFALSILNKFLGPGKYKRLRRLAKGLHKALFFNPRISRKCHGCDVMEDEDATTSEDEDAMASKAEAPAAAPFYDAKVPDGITDPFVRRAKVAVKIVDDLLHIIKKARKAARDRMATEAQLDPTGEALFS